MIKGVGGFSHAEWRAFHNEHTESECRSFVDGDLIEQFLDLKRESMERVAKVSLLPYNPLLSQMPRHAINASSSSWT